MAEGSFSTRFALRGGLRSLAEAMAPVSTACSGAIAAFHARLCCRRSRSARRFAKTLALNDHCVSEVAPPSCMMSAQRSRIALNMSSMAALIFKYTPFPWRTIWSCRKLFLAVSCNTVQLSTRIAFLSSMPGMLGSDFLLIGKGLIFRLTPRLLRRHRRAGRRSSRISVENGLMQGCSAPRGEWRESRGAFS